MIEKNTARREQAVRLPVVHRGEVGHQLRACIGAVGTERGKLVLGRGRRAEYLARGGLAEFTADPALLHGLEHHQRAEPREIPAEFVHIVSYVHPAPGLEVIYLVRDYIVDELRKLTRVGRIARMIKERGFTARPLYGLLIVPAGPVYYAVYFIPDRYEVFGHVGPVLAVNADYYRSLHIFIFPVKHRACSSRILPSAGGADCGVNKHPHVFRMI